MSRLARALAVLGCSLAFTHAKAVNNPALHESFRSDLLKEAKDPAVEITVEPKRLPRADAWVTVTFAGVSDPQPADMVVAFSSSPAASTPGANESVVPIKAQHAAASPDYLQHGNGSLRFQLGGSHASYTFHLLRRPPGDDAPPLSVAVSEALEGPKGQTVMGLHLRREEGQVWATWISTVGKTPQLKIREAGKGKDRRWRTVKPHTTRLTGHQICGGASSPPTVSTHSAALGALKPSTTYEYRAGDAGLRSWSASTTFTSPAGDAGVSRMALVPPGAAEVAGQGGGLSLLQAEAKRGGLGMVVDLQSAAVLDDDAERLEHLRPVASRVPWVLRPVAADHHAAGNGTDGHGCIHLNQALLSSPLPGGQQKAAWRSFNHGPVHVIALPPHHDAQPGSDLHAWLLQDLRAVNRQATPWLVLLAPQPFYTEEVGPSSAGPTLRQSLEEVLLGFHVDLVVAPTSTEYVRTCQAYGRVCLAAANATGPRLAPVHVSLASASAPTSLAQAAQTAALVEHSLVHHGDGSLPLLFLQADASSLSLSLQGGSSAMDSLTIAKDPSLGNHGWATVGSAAMEPLGKRPIARATYRSKGPGVGLGGRPGAPVVSGSSAAGALGSVWALSCSRLLACLLLTALLVGLLTGQRCKAQCWGSRLLFLACCGRVDEGRPSSPTSAAAMALSPSSSDSSKEPIKWDEASLKLV